LKNLFNVRLKLHFLALGLWIGLMVVSMGVQSVQMSSANADPKNNGKADSSHVKAVTASGPIEKIDCKVGTEDEQARIAVLARGNQVQSMAFYSKWKPRTCSIELQRGDAFTRWVDEGNRTRIHTKYGEFEILGDKANLEFIFHDVDRMHYCGMMGKMNGQMRVKRGPKPECSVVGVMDREDFKLAEEVPTKVEVVTAKVEEAPVPTPPTSPPVTEVLASVPVEMVEPPAPPVVTATQDVPPIPAQPPKGFWQGVKKFFGF
jgi:hypothetical protein